MRSEVQAVAWRAYWPVTLLAVTFLLVVGLFGTYLTSRQQAADARAEKQRLAICAILANIPGHIPREIAAARIVFARHGHPGDCQPIVRPRPRPTPAASPSPRPTVIIHDPTPAVTITATPTRTTRPAPRPTHTTTPRPSPTPTPSRTCIGVICLK